MNSEKKKKIEVLVTYSLSDDLVQKLNSVDKRLHFNGISARQANDISDDTWQKTEILITEKVLPLPEKVPNLRWVQFNTAGIDSAVHEPLFSAANITFTTLSGAAAPQAAEFVLMAMLTLGHKIVNILHAQRNHEWAPDRLARLMPMELRNSVVGLVGYGSIAREVARIVQTLDVKILATKFDIMHPGDRGFNFDGMGDPDGNYFTRLYPIQALKSMLKECDFVVITLPKTDSTTNLIAEEELSAMKSSAYLIDVSRGGIVKPLALKMALQEKRIAGAFKDVFEQEPLTKDNTLWDSQNLIISPHIAGISSFYNERSVDLIIENLKNYCQDLPLFNVYNPELGY